MNSKLFAAFLLLLSTPALAQVTADYNPPALGSSATIQRQDLDAEYDNINTLKVDFLDMDTSAELRAILTDETGGGFLMFGLSTDMSNTIACTGQQGVRRNVGNTAWECFTPSVGGGLASADIDTSAELRAIVTDETGTGALMFGITTAMANDIACTGTQTIRRNAGDTAWECFSPAGGLAAGDIDTSAELRTILTDEVGTGAAMFGITATMSDDISCPASQFLRRNAADNAWECAASTGLALITSGSFTAAATLDFTGLSAYRSIKLVINGARPATDGVNAQLLFSTDAGSTYTAGNIDGGNIMLSGSFAGDGNAMAGDEFDLNFTATGPIGNAAGEGIWATVNIESFNQTTHKTMRSAGNHVGTDGVTRLDMANGWDDSGVDFDSIRFKFSSGNIAAVGTYELWAQ